MIDSIENGRKEDGSRSIADKIIKRLHDLDQTIENNQGRWAWELLQNAKDSISDEDDRTVSVQILLNEDSVEFKHNGPYFTELDIRGLINQISSKEADEAQQRKKTGRFGTGFLTTHLLSKIIRIKGIVKTNNNEFYSFEFYLDRQAKVTKDLIPKIESAWSGFQESAKPIESNFDKRELNTSFCYFLDSDKQKEVAKIGIEQFLKFVPFVLAFIPKIHCVEVIDNTVEKRSVFRNTQTSRDDLITRIEAVENEENHDIYILQASNQQVSVAIEIVKIEKGYSVKNISDVPKIFCDFPFIGTESFGFPVVINSFYFNPRTERDGIWLKGDADNLEVQENQEILLSAVDLYKRVVTYVAEQEIFDLYNLADTRTPFLSESYFDVAWYKEFIQKPIREFIYTAKIVESVGIKPEKTSISDLWFPKKSYSDSVKNRIWDCIFDLYPTALCNKEHLHNWCKLFWDDWKQISYEVIVSNIARENSIDKLSNLLGKHHPETFVWLNEVFTFVLEDDTNRSLFDKYPIIPNQNGDFKKRSDIYIDEIEDKELVDILILLNEDWKNILLDPRIFYYDSRKKTKRDISEKITEIVNKICSSRGNNGSVQFNMAIIRLSEWFDSNSELGQKFFSELYSKRAELFMNTIEDKESLYKVMRSGVNLTEISAVADAAMKNPNFLQDMSALNRLLEEMNVNNVSELKEILNSYKTVKNANSFNTIDREVLLSLGVTSIEELANALKDETLLAQFTHTPTPSLEMFEYAQKLISRSKENLRQYLSGLSDYDCTDWEELATTVIGGIKKHGLEVHIVVRPSDNGQVIIYYSSEKDTLDYENAELWIDNGIEHPKHLTLGKILKKTGINKIPV